MTDQNGKPVEEAEIWNGEWLTLTDRFGYFSFPVKLMKGSPFLQAAKPGYFSAFNQVFPEANSTSRTRLQLVEKPAPVQFQAAENQEIEVEGGAEIVFPTESIQGEDGGSYDGQVDAYVRWIDPTDEQTNQTVSGNLLAIEMNGQEQLLESFGMLQVELVSPMGEPLNLARDVEITIPVPPTQMNSAPSEISLWYFDEDRSRWMEEGKVFLNQDKYVGSVSHFSLWNCDVSFPLVQLEGMVEIDGETPMFRIRIERSNGGGICWTYTNSDGGFGGKVPLGESLLLEVRSGACGNILHSQEIGPFSSDVILDPIYVEMSSGITEISGTILDCMLNTVPDGLILISSEAEYGELHLVKPDENGHFSYLLPNCNAEKVKIIGFDVSNGNYSETLGYPTTDVIGPLELVACSGQFTPGMFFTYSGGNESYNINNCFVSKAHFPALPIYYFVAYDTLSNKAVMKYTAKALNWNIDPQNPLWSFSLEVETSESPQGRIFFTEGNVALIKDANEPGELIIMRIINGQFNQIPSDIIYIDGTLDLVGRLE